jgi:DNA/RNA endonuclease G (NUC1)/PKD repeat protein
MTRNSTRLLLLAALAGIVSACTEQSLEPRPSSQVKPQAYQAPGPRLVITEVMGNPAGSEANGAGEWFEVFNAGDAEFPAQSVTLSTITGSGAVESVTLNTGVAIPAGAYAVFARNAATADVPTASIRVLYGTISLNNENREFVRISAGGVTLDSVAYAKRNATGGVIAPSMAGGTNAITRLLRDLNGNQVLDADENANGVCDAEEDGKVMASTFWEDAGDTPYANGANRGTPGTGPFTSGSTTCGVAGPVVTVEVTPNPASVLVNGTRQMGAVGRDAAGVPSATTYTWTSADHNIAIVSASGLVTGVALGQTTITATSANGVAGAAVVNVSPPEIARLNVFIPSDNHAPVGFSKRALVDAFDASNNPLSTTGVIYTVSDPSLATIDQRGYVVGLATGQFHIIVTAPNGVTDDTFYEITPATAPTSAVYRNHVEFGSPADANPGDDLIVTRNQFAASYNAPRGGPNWVSWNLNATHFGSTDRCDCFTPESLLPLGVYRVNDFDYVGSGYSRGHMTMSANRTTTEQENAATFYMSNILPQSSENNGGPWLRLENHLNDLARQSGKEIYIIAGGLYRANAPTLKNENKVAVPDYTWKVALIMNSGEGLAQATALDKLQVIAIKVPNDTTPGVPASSRGIQNRDWRDYQTTVDVLEAETGYDFLALLQDNLERIVEANDRPPVANAGGAYTGTEGSAITFDGSASSDPDAGDVLSYAWDFGDGTTAQGKVVSHTYSDNATYQVRLTVTDSYGADSQSTTSATVSNAAPALQSVNVPTAPLALQTALTITATFTDAGSADTHTLHIDWGDGTTSTSNTSTASHSYESPGLYTVQIKVQDDDGGVSQTLSTSFVPVFDAASRITAGGWLDAGGDKTHIETNARYDGVQATGHLALHSEKSDLRFTADQIAWLVLKGDVATLQATGTIAGRTGVFQVTVVLSDGDLPGGDKKDRARVILRDAAGAIVLDSQPGAALTALPSELFQGSADLK